MLKWWRALRAKNEQNTRTAARSASGWQCAVLASLVLGGFMAVNLAGCGGGSGGGSGPFSPSTVSVIVQLRDVNGNVTNGTVTLNSQTLQSTNGQALFTGLAPGTYPLTYDVVGDAFGPQTATINVGRDGTQTFVAVPGITGVGAAGITVSGRVQLNTGDPGAVNCSPSSLGVCAPVLIRVRDLNQAGQPIVASFVKPDQCSQPQAQWGLYSISNIPGPGTYRIEVRQAPPPATGPDTTAPFTGNSISFTITANQNRTGVNICANSSAVAPGTPPPPPVTPTPVGTFTFPTATPTSSLNATPPGQGIPTATPTFTPTPTGSPTATSTPQPTFTPTATVLP